MYEGKLIMYACIIRETFVFTVFRRVFHSILKLELCRHACRRRDQIVPTCRYGKNMPTTALLFRQLQKLSAKNIAALNARAEKRNEMTAGYHGTAPFFVDGILLAACIIFALGTHH